MKSYSIKAIIAISCLAFCEFALAGVGVRLYVKNSTGADLSSVGACVGGVHPGAVCGNDSFTVKAGDEVQIAYTELAINRTFDMRFDIADKASHYICTTRIIGQTNNSSYDPKVYSTIDAITQPIKGKDITHGCRRFGDLTDVNKNKVEVHIEILPVTMALTPAIAPLTPAMAPLTPGMAPLTPAKTQPLESLAPPLTRPLTSVTPANTQPFASIARPSQKEEPAVEEDVKSDNFERSGYGTPVAYNVTCADGRNKRSIYHGTGLWGTEEEGRVRITDVGKERPTLEEVRIKIGAPYCLPRASEPAQELYYMKSASVTLSSPIGHNYNVTCLDNNIIPTTFRGGYSGAIWTNGTMTITLPGKEWDRIYDFEKYLRFYVGERYCGNLSSGPFESFKVLSYGRSSKLDKTNANTTYTVACVSGNTSEFFYNAMREVYSNGTQAYRVKKQYKDNQDYLNLSIAERYCQESGKLDTRKNVGVMRAGTGTDSFTGLARNYSVICKNPMPSAKGAVFWRKDASEASWTNALKTYNLSQSDATLFKNGSDTDRYDVILRSVATPYCDGR